MRCTSRSARGRIAVAFSAALVLLLLLPGVSLGARAEDIPHENYDLIESDLDVVIALLNSSIEYSESALRAMYDQRMGYVDANLTIVTGILEPAERLLGEIGDVAGSYDYLSELLPPFASLASGETAFAEMESSLLAERYAILTAAQLANLTGEELLSALAAVSEFNSLVTRMNATIDQMLSSAEGIISLVVQGEAPFTKNELVPLIEQLRDLLRALKLEVDQVVKEDISWDKTKPFLLLWLDASSYHLGDIVSGGGYLYSNGSFSSNVLVYILKDGVNWTASLASAGDYSFQKRIPIDAAWLGSHTVQARASTPSGVLRSDIVVFEVLLIPSQITLSLSKTQISPVESVGVTVRLRSAFGDRLAGLPFNLSIDGMETQELTGPDGTYSTTVEGSELGIGRHSFGSSFGGALPYAPSRSSERSLIVDIPTSLDLTLFSSRLPQDYSVVGDGMLRANGTQSLSGKDVALSIDDHVFANVTTDSSGKFSFSIPAESLGFGTHVMRAEFLNGSGVWRYSMAEQAFTVISPTKAKYPFFPHIPGWGGMGLERAITYLFFGTYSYLAWLLLLALFAIILSLRRARKRRAEAESKEHALEPLPVLEAVDASLAAQPPPEGVGVKDLWGPAPGSPNQRIVWYYQRLLAFLGKRGPIGLLASMTHWEVARLLDALGFPKTQVMKVTVLFEEAFYSGLQMSDNDSVEMSAALTEIVRVKPAQGGEGSAGTT